MKKVMFLALAVCSLSACSESVTDHCRAGMVRACTPDYSGVVTCKDGGHYLCADGERCVEDYIPSCRNNKADSSSKDAHLCVSDPDGDKIDYEITFFQNPDNDNYWEINKKAMTDGFCKHSGDSYPKYGDIIKPGDVSNVNEGILACSGNNLYFSYKDELTGKSLVHRQACKDTEICHEIYGCIPACNENTGSIKTICPQFNYDLVSMACEQENGVWQYTSSISQVINPKVQYCKDNKVNDYHRETEACDEKTYVPGCLNDRILSYCVENTMLMHYCSDGSSCEYIEDGDYKGAWCVAPCDTEGATGDTCDRVYSYKKTVKCENGKYRIQSAEYCPKGCVNGKCGE